MRRIPFYGWFGLLTILVSQACMLARIEPFYHWHTPIAWTGYILLVDAVVWKRRGNSWLRNNAAELYFAAFVSVPLWVIFEIYNKYSIHNWYYIGLPELLLLRYFGYVWSFGLRPLGVSCRTRLAWLHPDDRSSQRAGRR